MTEAQVRNIWRVLLEVSGQKDVVVEVRPAEGDDRKEAVA
jgi:hypothetical protein